MTILVHTKKGHFRRVVKKGRIVKQYGFRINLFKNSKYIKNKSGNIQEITKKG